MNKYKELELLKETLKEVLASDELDATLWYLDEYKRLKQKELEEEEDMEESIEQLKEYKVAYEYLLEYWDSLDKEQHKMINKDLNKIFVLNKGEQVDIEEDEEE
jgi:hypothetical protein